MKVVYFEAYPGFRGAQRSLAALATELARGDVEPMVWCAAEGRAMAGYQTAGLPTRLLAAPGGLAAYGGLLRQQGALGRLGLVVRHVLPYSARLLGALRRERPAILHCNQARGLLLAAPTARLLGIPVLWHQRGMWDLSPSLARLCRHLASGTVCVSQAVRESLPGCDPARTWVVPNGIDPDDAPAPEAIARARRQLVEMATSRGLESPWVVATTSSLIPYKGLHHLAIALGTLVKQRPELEGRLLWLALGASEGSTTRSSYRRHIEELVAHHGLERRVIWQGWTDHPLPWLAAADVLALPTIAQESLRYADGQTVEARCSEGLPRSVLEAMLTGTPIVASRVAGVVEQIVDGESGRLVPPADPEALANALDELFRQPERGRQMADAAHHRLTGFTPSAMTEAIRRIYEQLTVPRSGPNPLRLER